MGQGRNNPCEQGQ